MQIDELPRTVSDLSAYQWHQNLSSYGHRTGARPGGDGEVGDEDDDDDDKPDESAEVVNALVTSVVIPRLERLARAAYDPLSSRQTVAALRVVDEVSYCVETSSPKFEVRPASPLALPLLPLLTSFLTPLPRAQSLIHAFLHRLRLSIAHAHSLVLPHLASLALPSLAYDPSTFIARQHFLHRLLKLVRACQRWRRFMRALRVPALPVPVGEGEGGGGAVLEVGAGATFDELVQRELVARTMLPVLEAAWTTGGEEIARKVRALFALFPRSGRTRLTFTPRASRSLTRCRKTFPLRFGGGSRERRRSAGGRAATATVSVPV